MNARSGSVSRRLILACCLALLLLSVSYSVTAEEEAELVVTEYGVGTDVVDRQLVGQADRFDEGRPVVFWTRVVGGDDGERIRHVWIREGEEILSVGLTLGGAHWRTHSRKTLHPGSAGQWRVEARDSADRVLAAVDFTCVGRDSGNAGGDSGG